MIRWFACNDIAANFLIFGILAWGLWSAKEKVALEVQPAIEMKQVHIDVDYRGGSPTDVEKAVVLPIEAALEGLVGVKSIESTAADGSGRLVVYATSKRNLKDLEEQIKTRVNRINSFPDEIEPPEVYIPDSAQWFDVIKVAVCGEMSETDLLRAARTMRDDLIAMNGISQAGVLGNSPPEISIEADPRRLRDFGLTFADVSTAIRRSSLPSDFPYLRHYFCWAFTAYFRPIAASPISYSHGCLTGFRNPLRDFNHTLPYPLRLPCGGGDLCSPWQSLELEAASHRKT